MKKMRVRELFKPYVRWNWNWNLDSALRYQPLIQLMEKRKSGLVVEIGSSSRGISTYAEVASIGVDVVFDSGVRSGTQQRVYASGSSLPFLSDSVDVVLCVDMLEHVSMETRQRVVEEMFRVVGEEGIVYIAVPFGEEAAAADRRVYDAYFKSKGKAHPMLVDHVAHGLPSKKEMVSLVEGIALPKGWLVQCVETTPIWLWEWNLMCFAVERRIVGLRHLQRILLQPFFSLFLRLKSAQNYRLIMTATRSGN